MFSSFPGKAPGLCDKMRMSDMLWAMELELHELHTLQDNARQTLQLITLNGVFLLYLLPRSSHYQHYFSWFFMSKPEASRILKALICLDNLEFTQHLTASANATWNTRSSTCCRVSHCRSPFSAVRILREYTWYRCVQCLTQSIPESNWHPEARSKCLRRCCKSVFYRLISINFLWVSFKIKFCLEFWCPRHHQKSRVWRTC